MTGVERKPSAVEIGLEPCAEIHWRRIDGDTDVAEVARAITRRNDKIKIDRCFVNDLAGAEGSSPIVQAVINIAKARNMTTTAEGVETEQQREMLLSAARKCRAICSARHGRLRKSGSCLPGRRGSPRPEAAAISAR